MTCSKTQQRQTATATSSQLNPTAMCVRVVLAVSELHVFSEGHERTVSRQIIVIGVGLPLGKVAVRVEGVGGGDPVHKVDARALKHLQSQHILDLQTREHGGLAN